MLAPRYPTLPVKEEGVEVVEEDGDADFRTVEAGGHLVSEERGHVGEGEEPVEPSLPLLRRQLPPRLLLLLLMLPTAFHSKGRERRIQLHLRRGPVRWLLVLVILWWRDMVTSVILLLGMTAQLDTRLFRVRRIALPDPRHRPLCALAVNSRHLLHERWHLLTKKCSGHRKKRWFHLSRKLRSQRSSFRT